VSPPSSFAAVANASDAATGTTAYLRTAVPFSGSEVRYEMKMRISDACYDLGDAGSFYFQVAALDVDAGHTLALFFERGGLVFDEETTSDAGKVDNDRPMGAQPARGQWSHVVMTTTRDSVRVTVDDATALDVPLVAKDFGANVSVITGLDGAGPRPRCEIDYDDVAVWTP
jgi:hypothetical protein